MRLDAALRVAVLGMIAAAVGDPGCDRKRLVPVIVEAAPDVPTAVVERVQRAIAAAGRQVTTAGAGPAAVRIGVGTPSGLLTLHRAQPLSLAVRSDAAPAHISDLVVPRTMAAGLASVVRVRLADAGRLNGTPPMVQVRDAVTGQRVGVSRVPDAAPASAGGGAGEDAGDGRWVDIDVLPLVAGRWSLCVAVARSREADESDDCERAEVVVAAADMHVEMFDARPSLAARFVRLALERWHGAAITSTVRVAPGIDVSTGSASTRPPEMPVEVTIVGGLDALESRDVARLAASARDQGRVVILLADGPVDSARLRPLWPQAMRTVATAAAPVAVRVGVHEWRVREWLAPPPLATDVDVLAYLDASAGVPAVLSRPLGAGRVVLVTALDAWRWRLMDGVAFDEAWQALVLSLAADARLARVPSAWRVPGPVSDEVHVALPPRSVPGDEPADEGGHVLRLADTAATPFTTDSNGGARAAGVVAASVPGAVGVVESAGRQAASTSVEVGGASDVPATWDDVRRSITANGATLVDEAGIAEAIERLPTGQASDGTRWFLTRQWWFATLVVAGVGLEWWLRRLARQV